MPGYFCAVPGTKPSTPESATKLLQTFKRCLSLEMASSRTWFESLPANMSRFFLAFPGQSTGVSPPVGAPNASRAGFCVFVYNVGYASGRSFGTE